MRVDAACAPAVCRPAEAAAVSTPRESFRAGMRCESPAPAARAAPAFPARSASPAALRPVFLLTFPQRARGLLGRSVAWLRPDEVLVFAPCASIHTLGMREPIDVAFLSGTGTVLRSERAVPPGRLLRCPGAVLTLERFTRPEVPAAVRPPWPSQGQLLQLQVDRPGLPGSGERAHIKRGPFLDTGEPNPGKKRP